MDISEVKYNVQVAEMDELRADLEALSPEHLTDRDHQVLKLAEALTGGKVLINMRDTILAGGYFESGRMEHLPKLALGRATERHVRCRREAESEISSRTDMAFSNLSAPGALSYDEHYAMQNLKQMENQRDKDGGWRGVTNLMIGDTLIPIVPPKLRPADGLDDCFVLFEVDHWVNIQRTLRSMSAVDPILCRRLAHDTFIVEAIWDMTKLEALATGL
jgi:hypothetical protein